MSIHEFSRYRDAQDFEKMSSSLSKMSDSEFYANRDLANLMVRSCLFDDHEMIRMFYRRMGSKGFVTPLAWNPNYTMLHIVCAFKEIKWETRKLVISLVKNEDICPKLTVDMRSPLYEAVLYDIVGAFELLIPRMTREQIINTPGRQGHTVLQELCFLKRYSMIWLLLPRLKSQDLFPEGREATSMFFLSLNDPELLKEILPKVTPEMVLREISGSSVLAIAGTRDYTIGLGQRAEIHRMLLSVVPVNEGEKYVAKHRFRFEEYPELVSCGNYSYFVDAREAKQAWRKEFGLPMDEFEEIFSMVVCLCDDYFSLKEVADPEILRFFKITKELPMELQAIVCHRVCGSMDESMPKRAELDPILYSLLCNC